MRNERRGEERLVLRHQPSGTLHRMASRLRWRVRAISDLSETGIALDVPLFDGDLGPVTLEYVEGRSCVRVLGRVVWRRPVPAVYGADGKPAGVQVGIELLSPLLLHHLLPIATTTAIRNTTAFAA